MSFKEKREMDTRDTLTILRDRATTYSAEGTAAGDYRAGKISHIADLLEKGTLDDRDAIYATNRIIRENVTEITI